SHRRSALLKIACKSFKRIVFPSGINSKRHALEAGAQKVGAEMSVKQGVLIPVLIGSKTLIAAIVASTAVEKLKGRIHQALRIARRRFDETSTACRLIVEIEIDKLPRSVSRCEAEVAINIVRLEVLQQASRSSKRLNSGSCGNSRRRLV